MSEKVESKGLADAARDHLAAELARLRQRRDRLEVEVKNDRGMIGDHGDAAEAIQRADELALLGDRTARSPLGQALAGHQPGDTVTYSTPQGPNQVQLLAVKLPS